ncbi:MAG: sporulation protein YqfD [Clostridia bacterium]|nr:sporulation protein YqfD [Clostridia bacterium]
MLKKIFKFIKGYVIIEITGNNKERFVNMCLNNFLNIYDVVPIEDGLVMKTDRSSFFSMRRLVKKCGVRVRIVRKCGAMHTLRLYHRRYGFFAAGAAVAMFLFFLPQYVLCVEIDGEYNADESEIRQVLREHGVYPGARKKNIDDLSEIKDAIVFDIDGINWAWLYDEGARMRLQIQESSPKPKVNDKSTPMDIVAAHDGFVTRADVYRGERHVSIGTSVAAGDTLVSGKVAVFPLGAEERYMYVHSAAKVIADTVRTESGKFSTTETLRIRTGRARALLTLSIFGRDIDLFRRVGYADYDENKIRHDLDIPVIGYSGLSLTVTTAREIRQVQRELTEDEVLARASEVLEERICKKLGARAVRTDEELAFAKNGDVYSVELRMHLKENIGIEVPLNEELSG